MRDTAFEKRLASIDLTRVMARVQGETGWDQITLDQAEDLYRKFLMLAADRAGAGMVPPVIVDEVWHAHVLHTRQYAADCDLLFGGFLHHEPTSASTAAAFEAVTLPAYAEAFGINLKASCGASGMAPSAAGAGSWTTRAASGSSTIMAAGCGGNKVAAKSHMRGGPLTAAGGCDHHDLYGAGPCD